MGIGSVGAEKESMLSTSQWRGAGKKGMLGTSEREAREKTP